MGKKGQAKEIRRLTPEFRKSTREHPSVRASAGAERTQLFEGNPAEAAAKLVEKLKFEARVI